MTAEIAVMNKEAIAIAADSAVTMRDETGEKIRIFSGMVISKGARSLLEEISAACIVKCPLQMMWPAATRLVVVGFGDREYFPSIRAYQLHGVFDGHLHCRLDGSTEISFLMGAAIIPFAQSDMAHAFLEGVDGDYQSLIEQDMGEILAQCPSVVIDGCDFLDAKMKAKLKTRFSLAEKQTQILRKLGRIRTWGGAAITRTRIQRTWRRSAPACVGKGQYTGLEQNQFSGGKVDPLTGSAYRPATFARGRHTSCPDNRR